MLSGPAGKPPLKGPRGPGGPRQVKRGDSAEEMYASCTSTIDELSPLAGTVGIELVPQTLALMAGSRTDSVSAIQQQAAGMDTQTASAPADKQQQQQPRPQEGLQQQPLAELSGDEAPVVHQQVREVSHGSHLADGSDPALIESEATAAVDSEHISHHEPQHWAHGSGSASRQHDPGCESDDEHAVLIAACEDQSRDNDQGQIQAPEAKMSKQQSAAAERQRVWYKERAVQLTILG